MSLYNISDWYLCSNRNPEEGMTKAEIINSKGTILNIENDEERLQGK
jgi:hypothetical protein